VAASYTFTLHAALWLPVTLLGGFFFWRNHLRIGDIEMARDQEELEAATGEATPGATGEAAGTDPGPRDGLGGPDLAPPAAPGEVRAI
jgi:hypothetical protein